MKKMLIMLAVAMLLGSGCGNENKKESKAGKKPAKTVVKTTVKAEELINYVPSDTNGVINIDAERLVNLPLFTDLRKENADFKKSWLKFESELQKYGLKTSDLPSKVIMFFNVGPGTQDAAVLALSDKISEAKLVELLKASKAKVSFATKTIGGRKAYIVNKKDAKNKDKVAITYIKENLVLLCDENKAERFFEIVGKTKNNKLIAADKKADKKALVNILYVKNTKAAKAPVTAPGMAPPKNPADNVNSAIIALNLVGKKQKDLSLKANVECIDKENAAQLTGQMKMMIMMMTMQFAQNQKLSSAVTKAIKVDQKDKNVKINISASEDLMKQIQTEMEKKKKQAFARRMAPAPMMAPAKTAPRKAVTRSAAPTKVAPKAAK